jgi:hypothetical protein
LSRLSCVDGRFTRWSIINAASSGVCEIKIDRLVSLYYSVF